MSTHPILSLKAAIRAHLLGHAPLSAALGGAVHDAPPRGANPPFLVLGDALSRENATNEADGRIIELELQVFTKERGSAAALALCSLIEERLVNAALTLDGHTLVHLLIRETQTRHDAKNDLTRASLKLRAFTHPL